MSSLIQEIQTAHSPESLAGRLAAGENVVLLRSALLESRYARYSLVAARPFLRFQSSGSKCEIRSGGRRVFQFGNPWWILDQLMARYEVLDEIDLPFPLGGCFGFWGYDLKNFVEPKLPRRAIGDLELPDCVAGFYASLVIFDHRLEKTWIVATGLGADGSRDADNARRQAAFWESHLHAAPKLLSDCPGSVVRGPWSAPRKPSRITDHGSRVANHGSPIPDHASAPRVASNLSRNEFVAGVERAQRYIRAGDIYQVNLSQRLAAACSLDGWEIYQRLLAASPAPFSAYLDCGEFQIASSSPELFLRLSGHHVLTRPIKGTRPRSDDPVRDARLSEELQSSPKEQAELVMITDLLRNDLGRVCEYGSVQVPELARLERYRQVQHLVSTVEGHLRPELTHLAAFASCFPGGSITGAPKFRAMEIIDEIEPVSRGPYTGALGYLGFNRESQLSILIRSAICREGLAYFNVGAGIVADSVAHAEYEETLIKAAGFAAALELRSCVSSRPRTANEVSL